jgi:outer membrane receptor protein involved in Fe transport
MRRVIEFAMMRLPLLLVAACAGTPRLQTAPLASARYEESETPAVAAAPAASDSRAAILADRSRRALLRGATVYGRDALAGSDGVKIADFLRRLPAGRAIDDVEFARTTASLRTCSLRGEALSVFVDGTRVADPVGALTGYAADDIEMIEVYSGAAQLPIEVPRGCSAVFLWMKRRVS